jgi:hypothetical protein
MERGGVLFIRKKSGPVPDEFIRDLRLLATEGAWKRFFRGSPGMFHVRYFWKDTIRFEIVNPDEPCDWMESVDDGEAGEITETYSGRGWRGWGLRNLRRYYRWRREGRVDWRSILCCPDCRNGLVRRGELFACAFCQKGYTAVPIPNFNSPVDL